MNRVERRAKLGTMHSRRLLPTLLAAAMLALAGCGGDDDGDSSSGGNSERPADQIVADAGLEICSEGQEQIAQSTVGPGLSDIRVFFVAEDCAGSETSPNVVRVYQFSTPEEVDAGAGRAKTTYPNGVVMVSGALVFAVTGPDSDANADAVGNAYTGATGATVRTV
jgi:hypothetical protein